MAGTFDMTVKVTKVSGKPGAATWGASVPVTTLDLTPFLGDGSMVSLRKSVFEPCGGFNISLFDAIDPGLGDSLYYYLQPMDMVEIRASREPWLYVGRELPLLMRGFISGLSRGKGMDDAGHPRRTMVISGQDSGKLLKQNEVLLQLAYQNGEPYLDTFNFQAVTGMQAECMRASDFYKTVIEKVVNPKIKQLSVVSKASVKTFLTDALTVSQGAIAPQMIMNYDGSIYDMMMRLSDSPWNEMFVRDTEAGPQLVYRSRPYKDISGKLIMPDAVEPGTLAVDISQVTDISAQRSDAGVGNFYWVNPGPNTLDTNFVVAVASVGKVVDVGLAANNPDIFGIRRMTVATSQLGTAFAAPVPDIQGDNRSVAINDALDWVNTRTKQLAAMNRDNVYFESGSLSLVGNELYAPGMFLRLRDKSNIQELYAEGVSHNFMPLQQWNTDIQYSRGTGWLNRTSGGQFPGWLESHDGALTGSVPVSVLKPGSA